jgi:hypothetical protein
MDLAAHILPEREMMPDIESEFDPWKIPESD